MQTPKLSLEALPDDDFDLALIDLTDVDSAFDLDALLSEIEARTMRATAPRRASCTLLQPRPKCLSCSS